MSRGYQWATTVVRASRSTSTNAGSFVLSPTKEKRLSNTVPVDLPGHLEAFTRPARDASRPTEFDPGDMDSPVGWLLGWLHGECVFDVDEAAPPRGSESADEEEVGASADDDFWDRLQRDELRGDPRLARYTRGGTGPTPLDDEVFLFLDDDAPPSTPRHSCYVSFAEGRVTRSPRTRRMEPSGRRPRGSACGCTTYSRGGSGPSAIRGYCGWTRSHPSGNFSALAGALLYCWLHDYLDEERLARLTRMLVTGAAGSDQSAGFLDSLDPETQQLARERLDQAVRDTVSTLLVVALRTDRRADPRAVFEWAADAAERTPTAVGHPNPCFGGGLQLPRRGTRYSGGHPRRVGVGRFA